MKSIKSKCVWYSLVKDKTMWSFGKYPKKDDHFSRRNIKRQNQLMQRKPSKTMRVLVFRTTLFETKFKSNPYIYSSILYMSWNNSRTFAKDQIVSNQYIRVVILCYILKCNEVEYLPDHLQQFCIKVCLA